jgi:lipopolysaccharide export system permease protein
MLSQLLMLFGFFSLILVMVYWINRAVVLFDQLIADGQSAVVFLEFTALSLPSVIRLALPLAAFAASVYVTNRLVSDSEMVAVQATGYSCFRLARPVLYFGIIVALLMTVLMHFLVPLSSARLAERQADISQNLTARLLQEGQFLEPLDGITVYIREVTPAGELRDVLLSDNRDVANQITYTAAQAYLVRTEDSAQLVMRNGLAQTLRTSDKQLFTTSFEDFALNIGGLFQTPATRRPRVSELMTWDLMRPTPEMAAAVRQTPARMISDAHNRISQSILGAVAALLGFAALMVGGFSRFGLWKQVVFAIFLIIVVKALETAGLNAARSNPALWAASYLPSIAGFMIVYALLFIADRPNLFKRRRQVAI